MVLEDAAWTHGHWRYVAEDFQGRTAIETLYKPLCESDKHRTSKKAGFDDRAVCNITGHKNVQSLDSYCGPSEREIRSLSSALDGETASCSSVSTSACSLISSCQSEEFSEMSTCESIAVQGHRGTAQAAFSSKKTVFKHVTFNFSADEAVADRACAARKMLKIRKKK